MSIEDLFAEFATSLFAIFLTMGTFVFTMKSFIITTMKNSLYDSDGYRKVVSQRSKEGDDEDLYAPLNRLRIMLSLTIWVTLLSGIAMLPLTAIGAPWCSVVAFILFSVSMVGILLSLCLVGDNLSKLLSGNYNDR